jgi:hypothetical protein
MILTLDEYKLYLPLQTLQNYNATITETHEVRALYKWFVKYLGSELVEIIAGDNPPEDLLQKVKPALANLTYLEALSFLNLVLTGSGFGIVSNQNMAPASTDRVRALAAGLLGAATNFLDSMLEFLETNTEDYPDWNRCSLNPGSLIPDATVFDSRLKINNSRVKFINLIPHIKEVETLQMGNLLSDEFLSELILGSDQNVKPLVEYACAYWAWERMVSPNFEPGEKKAESFLYSDKKMLYAKIDDLQARKTGEAYMLQALGFLNKHLDDYPTYKEFAYEAPYENKQENGFFIT